MGSRERVGPGGWYATAIDAGELLTISQVTGAQTVDLVSVDARRPDEHLSMYVSQALNGSWRLDVGDRLFSIDGAPLWELVHDDTRTHYLGGGYCSAAINIARYGTSSGDCRSNLEAGMRHLAVSADCVVPDACFNGFMRVEYAPDGAWRILESPASAGDRLTLRCLTRQLVTVSNCPQEAGPTNAHRTKPIDIAVD